MRVATFFALVLLSLGVSAATVPGKLTATYSPVTTGCTVGVSPCDGVTLAGGDAVTGYELFISTSPIADVPASVPTLKVGANVTSVPYTSQVANGSTLYVRVRAVNATGAGPLSNQASKLIKLDVLPGQVGPVTITIDLNVTT